MKIKMLMDRAHNTTLEQRTKEFRSSSGGDQSERYEGLTGMMCKLFSRQYVPTVDIDMFNSDGGEQGCQPKRRIDTYYQLC